MYILYLFITIDNETNMKSFPKIDIIIIMRKLTEQSIFSIENFFLNKQKLKCEGKNNGCILLCPTQTPILMQSFVKIFVI